MTDLHYLLLSAALMWVMWMTASLMRARAWTMPGLVMAFGNREDLPAPTPLVGRLERAGRNMTESFVLFAVLLFAAHLTGHESAELALPSSVFFLARVAYFPVYAAGIPYLRTAVWTVGLVAIAWIGSIAW